MTRDYTLALEAVRRLDLDDLEDLAACIEVLIDEKMQEAEEAALTDDLLTALKFARSQLEAAGLITGDVDAAIAKAEGREPATAEARRDAQDDYYHSIGAD